MKADAIVCWDATNLPRGYVALGCFVWKQDESGLQLFTVAIPDSALVEMSLGERAVAVEEAVYRGLVQGMELGKLRELRPFALDRLLKERGTE